MTAESNPTPKPVKKVEAVAEESKKSTVKTWNAVTENDTVRRVARNTVRFGILGTAVTVADEIIGWGNDKRQS